MADSWLQAIAHDVAAAILSGDAADKEAVHRVKTEAARRHGATRTPQDPELLACLDGEDAVLCASLLRKKPMRSQSGVAIVAVMSSPAACPHGKCIYCPGGPDVDAPQSYTGFEPSTMRAKRHGYDSYRIVRSRLAQLQRNGHPIDKIEIVVQGGTFPARDLAYQDRFIAGIYAACNDGPAAEPDHRSPAHDARNGGRGDEGNARGDAGPDGIAGLDGAGLVQVIAPGSGSLPMAQDAATPGWPGQEVFTALDDDGRRDALVALMQDNEEAACRVIGLTIETKPDWCFEEHVDQMLRHGATRIELGIQTLDDEVTRLTNRGHSVDDARRAMRVARDAGFKVCVHMMPGLPRPQGGASPAPARSAGWSVGGATPVASGDQEVPGLPRPQGGASPAPARFGGWSVEGATPVASGDQEVPGLPRAPGETGPVPAPAADSDKAPTRYAVDPAADVDDIRRLFDGEDAAGWQPDMLKIYPTLIVEEGETTIKSWWRQGRFEPLDTAGAVDVVAEALRHVPPWCRIQRIDRDIPTTHVLAGVQNSNLRQLAEAEAERRGVRLRDIRAREIGTRMRQGRDVDPARIRLVRRDYPAGGGDEVFLSLEDPEADAVAGFVRLRRPGSSHRSEFQHPGGVAVVRELKVYGTAQRIGEHDEAAWQHQGLGARLLQAAEGVAQDWGVARMLVIAGPGVKGYYRRHGYAPLGPYVAKDLP